MCDFGPDPDNVIPPGVMTGPLAVKPEIFKERQAVVINSSMGLTTVVPLSTVPPRSPMKIHYRIPAGSYDFLDQNDDSWVKADLIATVSNQRLDRPFVAGQRTTVSISKDDLREIRKTVLHALAMSGLTTHLDPPAQVTEKAEASKDDIIGAPFKDASALPNEQKPLDNGDRSA